MKVIILCGGVGTRLKDETDFKPKPMVYVGNKPIIWHIMKGFAHYGCNEFILALGYKAEYIKEFFLNQKAFNSDFTLETSNYKTTYHLKNRQDVDNFKITFVDTGLDTLIGERILMCKKYIPDGDKSFLVTYGDGVADINIKNLLEFHKEKGKIGTITGVHPRSKYGRVKVNEKGDVTELVEKPTLEDWVSGGFMVLNKEVFDYLKPNEMEHPTLKRLIKENELALYPHDGFWFSVDTFKELQDLNEMWNSNNTPWKVW
jgi:glucose-1-phosphate cytidylyltransferase